MKNWILAHQWLIPLLYPLVTSVVTALFKPHTAEELAAMPAWRRHIIEFCAATGFDTKQAIAFVKSIVQAFMGGKSRGFIRRGPMHALSGVVAMVALAVALQVVTALQGCSLITPKNVKTVLDIIDATCLVNKATLGNEEALRLCNIKDGDKAAARELLGEHRAAVSREMMAGAALCADSSLDKMLDGGRDAD